MNANNNKFNSYFLSQKLQQIPYYLILLLFLNMIAVTLLTIILLYNLGFNRQKERLKELAETQAVMISAITQQEFLLHKNISKEMQKKIAENIIFKVTSAHSNYTGFGKTGEFALGKRDGNTIQFLIKQRHFNMNKPRIIPWESHLGEPMRRALRGEKGIDILFDYHGNIVLAAYEPIKNLNWGIVAKVDLSEIRAPYIEAALYALGITVLLALGGSILFWFFLSPLLQEIDDSRYFNRLLISSSSAGLVLCLHDGKIIEANASFLDIIGFKDKSIMNLNYFDLIDEVFLANEQRMFTILQETGCIDPYESQYKNQNGESICVKVSGKIITIKGTTYLWLSINNIQDFKKREAELLLSDAVFHNTSEVIFITNASKDIIKVNQAFTSVTGYTPEEALGKNPRIFKSGKHDNQFYKEMLETLELTGKWHGEIWNKRKDGSLYPSLQSISAIHDENRKLIRYVSVLSDISLQKAYEQQLLIDSHHDSLTGLPNRLFFNQMLTQTVSRSQRTHKMFALFFIDINKFKEVNDVYGHDSGDTLLKTVATRLQENIRSEDFVARLGGDEFIIILESINVKEDAIAVAINLRDKVKQSFFIGNVEISPSISIGIAFYPEHGNDMATLLHCADQAMYFAKHHTQEHYNVYSM